MGRMMAVRREDRRLTSWLSNMFVPVICSTESLSFGGFSTIAPVFLFTPEYCKVAPIMESIKLPRNPAMPPLKLIKYMFRVYIYINIYKNNNVVKKNKKSDLTDQNEISLIWYIRTNTHKNS